MWFLQIPLALMYCKFHDDRYTVEEVIRAGIANAKRAGEQIGKETYVALDMGPTGKLLKPMGDLDFDDAYEAFAEAVRYGEKVRCRPDPYRDHE